PTCEGDGPSYPACAVGGGGVPDGLASCLPFGACEAFPFPPQCGSRGTRADQGVRPTPVHSRKQEPSMSKQPWALILGASSGFGEATAIELARAGMNIFGVHMDRRATLPHVEDIQDRIRALGRDCQFFNFNAADAEQRKD